MSVSCGLEDITHEKDTEKKLVLKPLIMESLTDNQNVLCKTLGIIIVVYFACVPDIQVSNVLILEMC